MLIGNLHNLVEVNRYVCTVYLYVQYLKIRGKIITSELWKEA
jgi:hypothetical protein